VGGVFSLQTDHVGQVMDWISNRKDLSLGFIYTHMCVHRKDGGGGKKTYRQIEFIQAKIQADLCMKDLAIGPQEDSAAGNM